MSNVYVYGSGKYDFVTINCTFRFTEDGEVFQIKKSSQSKKLIRMLDKERKKRREKMDKEEVEEVENRNDNDSSDDLVVSIL